MSTFISVVRRYTEDFIKNNPEASSIIKKVIEAIDKIESDPKLLAKWEKEFSRNKESALTDLMVLAGAPFSKDTIKELKKGNIERLLGRSFLDELTKMILEEGIPNIHSTLIIGTIEYIKTDKKLFEKHEKIAKKCLQSGDCREILTKIKHVFDTKIKNS